MRRLSRWEQITQEKTKQMEAELINPGLCTLGPSLQQEPKYCYGSIARIPIYKSGCFSTLTRKSFYLRILFDAILMQKHERMVYILARGKIIYICEPNLQ